jgi:chromate transporter
MEPDPRRPDAPGQAPESSPHPPDGHAGHEGADARDHEQAPPLPLRDIFLVFLKIGTFAFGGVYSMISFFERELVDRKHWLSHDELVDSFAIGQMTPGPPIVNTGICIGYRLRGLRGVLVTTLGQALTGTVLAIVLAAFYLQAKDNPLLQSVMKGVAAAVVGLLASIIYKMGVKLIRDWWSAAFCLGAFVSLAVFGANPIALILASGLLGLVIHGRR